MQATDVAKATKHYMIYNFKYFILYINDVRSRNRTVWQIITRGRLRKKNR